MSIATAILEQAREQWQQRPETRLTKIGLRLGELAGVDESSLMFCYEVLVKETDFEAVTLEIEHADRDELQLTFLEFDDD